MKPVTLSFSFLFLLSELRTVTDSRDQSANMPPAAASTFLTHDTTTGTSHPQLSYNTLTKLSFSSMNASEAPAPCSHSTEAGAAFIMQRVRDQQDELNVNIRISVSSKKSNLAKGQWSLGGAE